MARTALRPPPVLDHGDPGGALVGALPVLGSLGSIGLVATMAGGPRQYAGIALFVAVAVLVAVVQVDRQRRRRRHAVEACRTDYLSHLAVVREETRAAVTAQRAAAVARHPPPPALAALAEVGAWRPVGGLEVRYGVAERPADGAPAEPEIGARADPVCAAAVRRLTTAHHTLPDLPATVDLARVAALTAPPGTARALVCSATGCDGLVLAVLATPPRLGGWEWVKWLPQATSGADADGVGPRRLVASSWAELAPLLPADGHLLLVVDGVPSPRIDRPVTRLVVSRPGGEEQTAADRVTADGRVLPGVPDDCSTAAAEAFARRCARTADAPLDPGPAWSPRPAAERLRVALGTGKDGSEVVLDLKEAALGGAGPHGVVIGATGSGKSELLRSLVLRLALTHPPDDLNLVLVDFKGGAAFDGLAVLPHVAALITNLADELPLLDRTADALTSELTRRQEVLRSNGGDRSELPTLLVVVDEFAELLSARPELDELFVTLGRLGRSLGIHLLLASQRLDEGRWRGLESHLSYRIGLRTFTAEESRAVLGTADAYELPLTPGLGYLRTDPRTLLRFQAPYVGRAVRPPQPGAVVLPFTAAAVGEAAGPPISLVDAAVAAMRGRGTPARRIWLPPLERSTTLGDLLPGLRADPDRGFGRRGAAVAVGEVDRPLLQRRDPLELDLTSGHAAVVGGPKSGKTTLLHTAVAGLALTRTPAEVSVHLVDLGGGLAPLAGLPHVAGIAGPGDHELVRQIVGRLATATRPAVLVVDDWALLRQELPEVEEQCLRLVQRGGAASVHLLVSARRWTDLRPPLRDALATRIELRLGDPFDSDVDRRLAAAVPRDRPGRGIVDEGHFLAALPRVDGCDDPRTAGAGLATLVSSVRDHWRGPTPSRLRPLPAHVTLADLPATDAIRLGIDEGDHALRLLPPTGHLVVLGDSGSGRTGLLRTIAREIARTRDPGRAQLLAVDPRGSLAHQLPGSHLLAHVPGDPGGVLEELAGSLTRRLTQGRRGPDVWLLVDDLDLLPATAWQPLLPLLPRAGDVGLHLVAARRTGGAARAFYEPLLGTLRDLRSPGVLLSGNPEEGPLLAGVRPAPALPGRARWIDPTCSGPLFQAAWTPPDL